MSRLTYHYLLNGSRLSGDYIYDSMHLPNKVLQEKILKGYLTDRLHKLNMFLTNPSIPKEKIEWAKKMIEKVNNKSTLKEKVDVIFEDGYNRIGLPEILGKPYFGVWGIHTTPAHLFGVDPRYTHRLVIDCDSLDPSNLVIRTSNGKFSKVNLAMEKKDVKYTPSNYDTYCKPFVENKDLVIQAYSHKANVRTIAGSVPAITIFLPRLKFLPSDFEVFEESKDKYYRVVDMKTHLGIYEAIKKEVSLDMWKQLLYNDAISWLPKPPNTGHEYKGCISYFTKDGLEVFNKKTLPIFKKILGKARIKIEPIKSLPGKIVYKDQYQVVVRP